jgi:hypothetical protein
MADKKKKKKLIGPTISVDEDHPDVKALKDAGLTSDRIKQLAVNVKHPAVTSQPAYYSDPTDPSQFASDFLEKLGVPDTASNQKLIETQETEEGMPGYENNPLATTQKEAGSVPVNSVGVQAYPNPQEGVQADVQTFQQNDPSMLAALKSGTATPQQYAAALAASDYEGSNPAANQTYANSFLKDLGLPDQAYAQTGTVNGTTGSEALADAMASNDFSNLTNVFPAGANVANSLQSALASLGNQANQNTLTANTSGSPGDPDQAQSIKDQTNVTPASTYQQMIQALVPNIAPGAVK